MFRLHAALAASALIAAPAAQAQHVEAPAATPYHVAAGVAFPRDDQYGPGFALRAGASRALHPRVALSLDLEYQHLGRSSITYVTVPCASNVPCFPQATEGGAPELLSLGTELVLREKADPTVYLFGGGGVATSLSGSTAVSPQLTAGLGWEFRLGPTPTFLEFRVRSYPGARGSMEQETFPVTIGFRF